MTSHHLLLRPNTWASVQRHLEHLGAHQPDRVTGFVRRRLDRTTSPSVIAGLARHPLSSGEVRLRLEEYLSDRPNQRRLRRHPPVAGAIAGAANVLLDADQARDSYEWVVGLQREPSPELCQVFDSFGCRPRNVGLTVESHARLSARSGLVGPPRGPVRHRLVIASDFDDRDAIALLLPGAERTTLLATGDLFGKSHFDDFSAWPGVGEATVEHFRSRISRFSTEYIQIHQATAELARSATARVEGLGGPVVPGGRPVLELAIADFLFLRAITVAAIDTLLADEQFDHVVIPVAHHGKDHPFIQMLAGIRRLRDDQRVEVVSVARDDGHRRRIWSLLREISRGVRNPPRYVLEEPGKLDWTEITESAAALGQELPALEFGGDQRRALLVTSDIANYNESTAAYARLLSDRHGLRVLSFGEDADELAQAFGNAFGSGQATRIDTWAPPQGAGQNDLTWEQLASELSDLCELGGDDLLERATECARIAMHANIRQLCQHGVLPHLTVQHALRVWFARLADGGALPHVVVLTPQRRAAVTAVATVAREFGVPSLAVEPHLQDANYCRYIKTLADYYGVVSEYFRHRAAEGFGIELDRVAAVGTPRLVAPRDFDRSTARLAAREELTRTTSTRLTDDDIVVLFVAQPSAWSGVASLWRITLDAAAKTGARVLLKPHPEESSSRIRQYLSTRGAEEVTVVEGDFRKAAVLADIAVTAYSTAGVDAVLVGTPVICVSDGDHPYPLDIPAMIDAPLARSTTELSELLEEFKADPSALRSRAAGLPAREPQFIEGPAPAFHALVDRAVERGPGGIRPSDELPRSLFLDGPHPTFPV